jgi:hypothetical protein
VVIKITDIFGESTGILIPFVGWGGRIVPIPGRDGDPATFVPALHPMEQAADWDLYAAHEAGRV